MDVTSKDEFKADIRKKSHPELKDDPPNPWKNLDPPAKKLPAKPSHSDKKPEYDWLEEYVDLSRIWSPRAYDDFHEACGLWLLSTIAARRLADTTPEYEEYPEPFPQRYGLLGLKEAVI